MKRRKGWIALVIFLVLVITGIVFRKPFLRATMPEVEDVVLTEFVLVNDSAFVTIALTVRNKAVWHIELTHVHLGIFDDTLEIMSYESDTVMIIKRNEVKREEIYCKIPFKEVSERIRQRQGEDTVGLHLIGELVFTTFLGESSTVIDRKIPVNIPIPPRMYIRGITFTGKEEGNHNVVFDLTLINDNPREVELEDVSYELHAGVAFDLVGHLNEVSIAARDSTMIKVPAVLTTGNRFTIISQIILDTDVMPYSFVMKGTIVSFTGIVDEDVPMTVRTTGQMELYNENKRDRPKITWKKKR